MDGSDECVNHEVAKPEASSGQCGLLIAVKAQFVKLSMVQVALEKHSTQAREESTSQSTKGSHSRHDSVVDQGCEALVLEERKSTAACSEEGFIADGHLHEAIHVDVLDGRFDALPM